MSEMLSLDGVDAAYGASRVLFGVGFSLAQGQTLALLGRNGAGKSTTMKAIAGVVPPSAGQIMLRGQPIAGLKPHMIARLGSPGCRRTGRCSPSIRWKTTC